MAIVGMDPMRYLRTKDYGEARVMEAILQHALEEFQVLQQQQAIMIANAVGKMFK